MNIFKRLIFYFGVSIDYLVQLFSDIKKPAFSGFFCQSVIEAELPTRHFFQCITDVR